MNAADTFAAVRACAVALLGGSVLSSHDVTAGNGIVVDWRTVKCGETMTANADAFDVAQLFVTLVGPDAALASVQPEPEAPAVPKISAYMRNARGARRRSFDVGGFRVYVEPHDDDDAAQESFTRKLASLAMGV